MLKSKEFTYTSIKKCNKKSLNFCCSHHQILSVNTILNINKLTNSSESVLKIKSVRAKSVKNAMNTVSNTVDILALLKWNAETECDEEECWA